MALPHLPGLWQTVVLVLGYMVIYRMIKFYHVKRLMPPGPRGIPLLGNILQLPAQGAWLKMTQWKNTYGTKGII